MKVDLPIPRGRWRDSQRKLSSKERKKKIEESKEEERKGVYGEKLRKHLASLPKDPKKATTRMLYYPTHGHTLGLHGLLASPCRHTIGCMGLCICASTHSPVWAKNDIKPAPWHSKLLSNPHWVIYKKNSTNVSSQLTRKDQNATL